MQKVAAGDPEATQELCIRLSGLLRKLILIRSGANDAEDQFHDLMLRLIQQLQKGALRDPDALLPYVYEMARRRTAAHFRERMRAPTDDVAELELSDPKPDPEAAVARKESLELVKRLLQALPRMQREMLVRFYLLEQRPEDIQAALGMTPTQFRLGKWRAKARFTELFRAAQRRSPAASS